MFNFLIQGGIIGMLIITAFGLTAIGMAVYVLTQVLQNKSVTKKPLNSILYLGSMAFFAGLAWNALGFYQILDVIQLMGGVSQTALAGGLKAACISTIWGLFLFFIAYVSWYILRLKVSED